VQALARFRGSNCGILAAEAFQLLHTRMFPA